MADDCIDLVSSGPTIRAIVLMDRPPGNNRIPLNNKRKHEHHTDPENGKPMKMDGSASSLRGRAHALSFKGLHPLANGLLLWCWWELGLCMCAEWHLRILVLHMEPLISYLVFAFGVHTFGGHGVPDRAFGYDVRRPYIAVPVYSFLVVLFLVGSRFAGGFAPSSCFFPR